MNKDLVSVIVPSYNHEKYINDSIDGILNQTYNNLELIVVDDKSIDNTYDILISRKQDLCNKCNRVEILKNDDNLGISRTLNKAISKSKGEYIKVIASDDILCKHCIEDLVKYRKNINEPCLIHSSEYLISTKDNYYTVSNNCNIFNKTKTFNLNNKDYYYNLLNHGCIILSPTTFYDKEIFIKLGGYNENICVEDYPFFIKVAQHFPIYYLDEPTVYYRLVNTNKKSDQRIKSLIECYNYILDNYFNDIQFINRKKLVYRSLELYKQAMNKNDIKEMINNMKHKYDFNTLNYLLFSFYYNIIKR